MRDVVDILARLVERAATGSKSDRRLARLILDDPDVAPQAPIAERIGPAMAEGLRRIRHGLVTLEIEDPRLPLGD